MKKILGIVAFLLLSVTSGYAQGEERMVSLDLELPMKRTLTAEDFKLGGSIRVPLTDRITVNGGLSFKDATNLFLVPTDQVTANGEMWFYFANTTGKARPFVFGGMEQNMFTNSIPDSTNGIGGFGVHYATASGFHLIPKVRYTTKDFTGGFQSLGQEYTGSVEILIPLGKTFRFGIEPYAGRKELFASSGFYSTVYGGKVKIGRVF